MSDDYWVKGTRRVIARRATAAGSEDLLVVLTATGKGRYEPEGDWVFPEHLRGVGFVPASEAIPELAAALAGRNLARAVKRYRRVFAARGNGRASEGDHSRAWLDMADALEAYLDTAEET